jgi:hypothetical protein
MSTVMARIAYEDNDVPAGEVVCAVEVSDVGLRTAGWAVVRAGVVTTLRLEPGRYFVRGRFPSGEPISGVLDVPRDGTGYFAVARPALPVDGEWLEVLARPWLYTAAGWRPEPPQSLRVPAGGSVDLPPLGAGGRGAALQLGDGETTVLAVVPAGLPLRLAHAGRHGTDHLEVHIGPGTEATLLSYLWMGDTAPAAAIAAEVLASSPEPGGGCPVLDIVMGYHLLRTQGGRAPEWISALEHDQPTSADAAILVAVQAALEHGYDAPSMPQAVQRAVHLGSPIAAEGVHLLANLFARVPHSAHVPETAARWLVLAGALLGGPLTSYPVAPRAPANDPLAPATRPLQMRLAPASAATGPLPPSPAPRRPMSRGGDAARLRRVLASATNELVDQGFGTAPTNAVVAAAGFKVAVDANACKGAVFDVDVRVSGGTTAAEGLDGATASLGVDGTRYHMSMLDAAGHVSFTNVPAGRWRLGAHDRPSRPRLLGGTLALPLPGRQEIDMAQSLLVRTDVLLAIAPSDRARYALFRKGGAYGVEVLATPPSGVGLTLVEYTRRDRGTTVLLVPLHLGALRYAASAVRLSGFDPTMPWHCVGDVEVADLADWEAEIAPSIGAADQHGTVDAWRAVAALAVRAQRAVIEDALRKEVRQ